MEAVYTDGDVNTIIDHSETSDTKIKLQHVTSCYRWRYNRNHPRGDKTMTRGKNSLNINMSTIRNNQIRIRIHSFTSFLLVHFDA